MRRGDLVSKDCHRERRVPACSLRPHHVSSISSRLEVALTRSRGGLHNDPKSRDPYGDHFTVRIYDCMGHPIHVWHLYEEIPTGRMRLFCSWNTVKVGQFLSGMKITSWGIAAGFMARIIKKMGFNQPMGGLTPPKEQGRGKLEWSYTPIKPNGAGGGRNNMNTSTGSVRSWPRANGARGRVNEFEGRFRVSLC